MSCTSPIGARVNGGITRVNGGSVLVMFYSQSPINAGISDHGWVEKVTKSPKSALINHRLVCTTEIIGFLPRCVAAFPHMSAVTQILGMMLWKQTNAKDVATMEQMRQKGGRPMQ